MSKGSYMGQITIVSGGAKGSYENKSQISYNDKQSGSYARATATEKTTEGDFYWKNGTNGTRSEYKQTETVRVGDKNGYTEIFYEQRVRDVTYSNNYDGKSVVNYDKNVTQGGACTDEFEADSDTCSDEGEECEGRNGGACSDEGESDGGGAYESDGCDYDSDYDSDY